MPQIIDQYGQPLQRETLETPQTARVGQLHQEFATHPSRGLTPAKLARILDAAEQGDILAQHDLFLDMEEKDAHIYSEMSKRKRAILTVPWAIQPPRNASAAEQSLAAEVEEMVRDIANIEDVFLDMMDGVGHGFANLEIEWAQVGKQWLPKAISHRPQSWFALDQATRTELRLRDLSMEGMPLQPFGWISHVHRAKSGYIARSGLHRVLSWPYLYKNYSVRDLAEFLEIYGLPLRLGKYPPGASDREKSTLLSAVVNIGHNAAGIIPEGMMIEIMEAAKGSQEPFMAMVSWAEMSQSKAILGGTLTSQADGKSSTNALGNVHNEVRHDLLEADARQVASTLNNSLIHYLVALNKGGAMDPRRLPRLVFDTGEPEDFALFAEALPKLADAGAQIPVSWVHERLRIPLPAEGEAVLGRAVAPDKGAEPPDGAPASTGGSNKYDAALINAYSMGIDRFARLGMKIPKSYIRDVFGLPEGRGEDVLVPAEPPTGAALAALTASAGERAPTDPVEVLTDQMSMESAPALKELLDQVRYLAETAESLEQLRDWLLEAYGDLDPTELQKVMQAGFATAELVGRFDVSRDG